MTNSTHFYAHIDAYDQIDFRTAALTAVEAKRRALERVYEAGNLIGISDGSVVERHYSRYSDAYGGAIAKCTYGIESRLGASKSREPAA